MSKPSLLRAALPALAFMVAAIAQPAAAQAWPSQPIRIIAPFGAGGGGDTTIRLLATQLSQAVSQSVIVDNKPGANGVIGAEEARRAPADGHTLFYGSTTTLAANASLLKHIPYDALKDFTPVLRVGTLPFVLVVHPSVPARSVSELIAWARANPSQAAYASSNITGQVSGAAFAAQGGVKLLHVPYKATTAGLVDVMSGRVPIMFLDLPPALEQIKAGKLRALGVTSRTRTALLPDVPAIAEAGLPSFEVIGWTALVAPAGVRPEIVNRLGTEMTSILAKPEVRQAFANVGVEVSPSTPAALGAFMASEKDRWAQMVKAAGIEPE